ncbi:MAG: hypothetical protein NC827_01685 [Candidatus Omnitrophica bacterium]|nr:hypothetical protein [Candidatus Omnitrophota bacterium]MCM8802006.1 hypothetical protein [Candidatus Omnitrophota bacterium]
MVKNRNGLTVVEMIISLVSGIIILITIGYILYYSKKTYIREEKIMELKREGISGVRFIEKKLRDKNPDKIEIQEGGKKLIIKK